MNPSSIDNLSHGQTLPQADCASSSNDDMIVNDVYLTPTWLFDGALLGSCAKSHGAVTANDDTVLTPNTQDEAHFVLSTKNTILPHVWVGFVNGGNQCRKRETPDKLRNFGNIHLCVFWKIFKNGFSFLVSIFR